MYFNIFPYPHESGPKFIGLANCYLKISEYDGIGKLLIKKIMSMSNQHWPRHQIRHIRHTYIYIYKTKVSYIKTRYYIFIERDY